MTALARSLLSGFLLATLAILGSSVTRAQSSLPTPQSVFGWESCADYKLLTYEQTAGYFRKLDAASDRMQLVEIGKTAEGRTQLMAIVSSEKNLRNIARYKEIAQKLAAARGLSDEQARALAEEGKAILWIDVGIHSTEVAPLQMMPEFAHKMISDESAEVRAIRDNVILLLVPSMNPDGMTMVANWYMKHVGTAFELSDPPELYHKYVGHDNNRDWYMFNMPETRNIGAQLYHEWFPQIVYNQHQTGPFPARIFIPPYEEPMNPNIPPLVMRGISLVGGAMARRLEAEGKAGVISRINYDTWWNGGMRSAPYYHNMVGILTEAQHNSATPNVYDPKRFPQTFANGESTTQPSSFYPNPFRGGEWHIRNTCDYVLSASMAVADIGAKRRAEWLYNIYQMGRDAIAAGARETYVVPAEQWDAGTAVKMINVLRLGGIEVGRATQPFTAGGKTYGAGSFVIRGAQPFRAHLTDLLNPQVYPDRRLYPGGPPERPYDITGWTLPMQMGVRVDRIAAAVDVPTEPVTTTAAGLARPIATAATYAIDTRANDAFIAVNRLLAARETVERTSVPLSVGASQWPAGTFLVSGTGASRARLEESLKGLAVRVEAAQRPSSGTVRLGAARVGVYHAWGGNMDEGWTRWLLEQFEFPYVGVHDEDIRAGKLSERFDAIVLPDATYKEMLTGLSPHTMPDEYTGGMTPRGVANLYEFVAGGGTLIAMDNASELPLVAFGLPVTDVTANRPESEFYIPGTVLRLVGDPSHPLAFGMPAEFGGFFIHSPAFAIQSAQSRLEQTFGRPSRPSEHIRSIARYPEKDILMSGWLLGDDVIKNRHAVIEVAVEKGRVVLLGFRTQHRGQPHGTFKLLFNSILSSTARGAGPALPSPDSSAR